MAGTAASDEALRIDERESRDDATSPPRAITRGPGQALADALM